MSLIDEIYSKISPPDYEEPTGRSEIRRYYAGKTIFITGATGFMGILLVEKLLRGCPKIRRIYLIIREKRGVKVDEKAKRYFSSIVFDKVREADPNFQDKITILVGEMSKENLALSETTREILKNEVDVMIHNAANVYFDVKVGESLKCNVLGTKTMLDLAMDCKHLDAFVYISTAYSHCYMKEIHEKCYDPPAGLKSVQDIIAADEIDVNGITPDSLKMLLGQWPNIYVFSKSIAESIVEDYAKRLNCACTIFRPTVVSSTYEEPMPGWIGNSNGPVKLLTGVAAGVIKTLYFEPGVVLDGIPADLVINAIIATTWDAIQRRKTNHKSEVMVYNYGTSGSNNAFNLVENYHKMMKNKICNAGGATVWYPNWYPTSNWYLFVFLHIYLHFIPACLVDAALLVSMRKPRAVSIFWKATQHMDKINYFINGNWKIHTEKTFEVVDKMTPVDKELFYCDTRTFDWDVLVAYFFHGIQKYMLKKEVNVRKTEERMCKLKLLNYLAMTIYTLGLFYLILKIFI